MSHYLRIPSSRANVIAEVGKILVSEVQALCSDSFQSVLRSKDVNDLKTFTWDRVLSEAQDCAPTLLQLLESCTRPASGGLPKPNRKAIIGLCICILCRYRRPSMSLFQKIISLILYSGHSAKQVSCVLRDIYIYGC